MRLISWNVNGIRAVLKKGFWEWFDQSGADILCLQETKAQEDVLPAEVKEVLGYQTFYSCAEKKGYSGVSTWSKEVPENILTSILDAPSFDTEGRIMHTSFPEFELFNIYFPNGTASDERLAYKMAFYEAFQKRCEGLIAEGKEVIICGDVNTSHNAIDLARPKANEKNSGFLPEERAWMDRFTAAGFTDTFRHMFPNEVCYSWWSYRGGARQKNVGWRLDYFFVSQGLLTKVKTAGILTDVMGSDHCPVYLELDL
ncbi:MAG: exodeoxyribonuclease III [Lentisphaeria bacterium]|nr:exodeoxyribonuclease III [Lentisphaeria bacterium]